ncbi:MAG: tRNA-dihydrouridine synthase, partial [bacterium]
LFVHGRTWKHAYCGDVTYEGIKAIKESVKIPVYGSGSVFSPELAKKMLDLAGCDGVMVARGAMGNPWIFKSIEEYLKTGELLPEPTPKERMEMLKRHLSYMEKYKESRLTNKIGWMRRIAIYYIKNLPGAAAMRHEVTSAKCYDELMGVVDKI